MSTVLEGAWNELCVCGRTLGNHFSSEIGCRFFRPANDKARQIAAAERAVIDAAKAWANASDRLGGWKREESAELLQAVRALEAEEG